MVQNVYIGMAVTSHDYSNSTTVTFDSACDSAFVEKDLVPDGLVNFEDYAELMNQWMDKVYWP